MNSSITVASVVSSKVGNKTDFFFWVLACLLSKCFKTHTLHVDLYLIKGIERISLVVLTFEPFRKTKV